MAASRGRRGGYRTLCAGLAGLVLLAACVSPLPAELRPEVLAPYLDRVQVARGVEVAPVVEVHLLLPGEVRGRIELEMGRLVGPEQRTSTTALLRSLGWIARHADPWEGLLDLQAESVAGFFAAIDGRLYLVARGERLGNDVLADPMVEEVLVHELAHAFQADVSPLPELGLALDGFDDVAFALAAVLEGDALWTEHRDAERIRGQKPPDVDTYVRRFELDVEAALPESSAWLRATLFRPYPLGYRWVRQVWAAEGPAGLTRMLAEPPLSSAALLHPERAQTGRNEIEARVEQFAPDEACRTLATNSFGEIGLRTWFPADVAPPPEAEAWRADRAWLLACPEGEVLAWLLLLDRPEAARALEPRLRERASTLPFGGAQVERIGSRLLVQRGLDQAGRRWLLGGARARHYPDLAAWLEAHPEILERSARLREHASGR
ncbi:MAG: hypothetical protein GY946_11545 [bacterium]|nr:hypothetical protein [bacterium]